MKSGAFVFFSSLLLVFTSCSDHSSSNRPSLLNSQLEDSQIVNIMITVDKGEIAASEEAIKKKVNPSVEDYANYLIEQHQENLDKLNQLTEQLGIEPKESTISNSLVINGKHDLQSLDELENEDFDKAFINAMVKDHQGGLELIDTKLLPQVQNPQVKEAVQQFRQMVANHLAKALEVQKNL